MAERVSAFLSRRPILSFVLSGAVLAIATDSVNDVYGHLRDARVTVWTWAAGLFTAYTVVMMFYLPPRLPRERRASIRWATAIAPSLYGWVAVVVGSPETTAWVGFATSAVLLGWGALAASREK